MAAVTGPLSVAEMATFKRDGYLLRRGVLDPELCRRCQDRLWDLNGSSVVRRNEPSTWVGPLPERDFCEEPATARSAFRLNCRAPGHEELFKGLLPQNPTVLAIAEQLLGAGETSAAPRTTSAATTSGVGTRGVYCTLPMGGKPKARNQCHIDDNLDSRGRLGVVAYIDDVGPGGGSFMVWPRSHHRFHRLLAVKADTTSNGYGKGAAEQKNRCGGPDHRPNWAAGMQEAWEEVERTTAPVDCYGALGTVVFYHARLGHMAGSNYSSQIRQAVISGFAKTPESLPDGDELLAHALEDDIWRDWSGELRAAGVDFGRLGGSNATGTGANRRKHVTPIWYSSSDSASSARL